jgi:selenocysteine-specific elongation factor
MSTHIVVGTAGHIDHGKSTLVEALTGVHPDRLEEERVRGITIDLGFAHLREGDRTIAFVDVPGHERFVRNMLAGAGGIDAALLVVAADESVMPQTREHFDICRLLGVRAGLVVLTKSDLADPDMLAMVRADVASLVAGSFLEEAPIIEVSARTGAGLPELRRSLWRLLDRPIQRSSEGPARLPIDRVFSMRGFGTVVTGTLARGRVTTEDALDVVPGGATVKVRGVQVHGAAADAATAGERTALNLAGVEVGDLKRGQVLVTSGTLQATRLVDVAVDVLPSNRALTHGTRVRFHQGTAEVLARVSIIALPGDDGAPPAIEPGARGFARVRLEAEAAVTRGDRFVLRTYSPIVTVGGGVVLDPDPPRGGVRLEATLSRLAALAGPLGGLSGGIERDAHAVLVAEAGGRGLPAGALVWRAGVAPSRLDEAVQALVDAGQALAPGGWLVAPRWETAATERVLAALAAHHEAAPLSEGMPREEVRERILAGIAPALADRVLAQLESGGRITGRDRLALSGRRAVLAGDDARVAEDLERVLRQAHLAPPDATRLADLVHAPTGSLDRVLQFLVRQRVVQRLDGLPFHRDALESLKADVAGLKGPGGEAYVDVAAFKHRYGLTRKFAIPLLEYLDRERVTRRVGDRRLVL